MGYTIEDIYNSYKINSTIKKTNLNNENNNLTDLNKDILIEYLTKELNNEKENLTNLIDKHKIDISERENNISSLKLNKISSKKINYTINNYYKIIAINKNNILSLESKIKELEIEILQLKNTSYKDLRDKYFKYYHNKNVIFNKFLLNNNIYKLRNNSSNRKTYSTIRSL
jgi:hypothetical protein